MSGGEKEKSRGEAEVTTVARRSTNSLWELGENWRVEIEVTDQGTTAMVYNIGYHNRVVQERRWIQGLGYPA